MFHLINKGEMADNLYDKFINHKNEVIKELNGFFNKKDSLITYKTLRQLDFGRWYYNDDKTVKFKLIRLTEDEAVFISVLEPNKNVPVARFGLQRHDCIERGVIVEGHLIDDLNHLKVLKDEKWEYKKNQKHEPYAKVRSIYEVTFSEE